MARDAGRADSELKPGLAAIRDRLVPESRPSRIKLSDIPDRGGVRSPGFVHVQAGWLGHGPMGPVGETCWLESVCGAELLGIVAQAKLDAPYLATLLDAHAAASVRLVGVRDMTAFDADPAVMNSTAE